jgi:hypothetical protein
MALKYVTGRDLNLTITTGASPVSYTSVASGVTLTLDTNQQVLETVAGRKYVTIDRTATLTAELYQDWGSTSPASVCETLWDLAKTAPDTAIAFSFTANGEAFTGNLYPNFPTVGGNATDALTVSVSFVVDQGSVTHT